MTAPTVEPHRQDRAISLVGWLSFLITVITLVMAAVILPAALDSKAGIEAQNRSDEIAACRSGYRADIDAANDQAADAESQRIDAFSDVILASISEDPDAVRAAGVRLAEAKAAVAVARARVRKATAANAAAVTLSASNRGRFIAGCRQRRP